MRTSATWVNGDCATTSSPHSNFVSRYPMSEVPLMLVRSVTAPPGTAALNLPVLVLSQHVM